MILITYLKEHGINHTAFADQICVSVEAARRYAHGQRYPRPEIMQRIIAATNGVVGPQDFLDQRNTEDAA